MVHLPSPTGLRSHPASSQWPCPWGAVTGRGALQSLGYYCWRWDLALYLVRPDFHAPSLWSWEDTSVASVSILQTFLAFFFFLFLFRSPSAAYCAWQPLLCTIPQTVAFCHTLCQSKPQTADILSPVPAQGTQPQPSASDFEDLEMVTYFFVPDHLQTTMPLFARFQAVSLILEC